MFHKVELTLEPDGIAVYEKNLSISHKTHINFEDISPKSSESTSGSKNYLIIAIILTALTLISVPAAFASGGKGDSFVPMFWGVIAAILWIAYFSSCKSLIQFSQNGSVLNLYKNKPSEQMVDAFIKKMFEFRKNHLLKKYGRFLAEENFENKIARLNYLRAQDVLSEEEFESKREEFSSGSKKPSGPFGFSPQ